MKKRWFVIGNILYPTSALIVLICVMWMDVFLTTVVMLTKVRKVFNFSFICFRSFLFDLVSSRQGPRDSPESSLQALP